MTLLLGSIRDLMQEVRQLVASQPGLPQSVLAYHRRIPESVLAGDPSGARKEMQAHLLGLPC